MRSRMLRLNTAKSLVAWIGKIAAHVTLTDPASS